MYLLHGADLLHTWEHTEFPPSPYLFIYLALLYSSFYLFLRCVGLGEETLPFQAAEEREQVIW